VRAFRPRSVYAIALENAVEGCIRETYGALLATWQSVHAQDPGIRRRMRTIAADETRHAALSWRVARFLENQLDARQRARVERARVKATRELLDSAMHEPAREIAGAVGLPSSAEAKRLLGAFAVELRTA
jgi:hypothetical protein